MKKTRDMIGGWRERVDERLRFIYVFEIIGTLGLFDFSNVALPLIILFLNRITSVTIKPNRVYLNRTLCINSKIEQATKSRFMGFHSIYKIYIVRY